jgi:hypothetical protein
VKPLACLRLIARQETIRLITRQKNKTDNFTKIEIANESKEMIEFDLIWQITKFWKLI